MIYSSKNEDSYKSTSIIAKCGVICPLFFPVFSVAHIRISKVAWNKDSFRFLGARIQLWKFLSLLTV